MRFFELSSGIAAAVVVASSLALAQYRIDVAPGAAGSRLGTSVASIDDIDGDGIRDLIVGAPGLAGSVSILSGAHRSTLVTVTGSAAADFGAAVAAVGDLDGDGLPDFVVGAPGQLVFVGANLVPVGAAFAHSSANGALLHSWLGAVDGDRFGHAVSSAGDVDGDGVDDVAVGAPLADPVGFTDAGRVVVFSGTTGAVVRTLDGDADHIAYGASIAVHPDLDADGTADLIVGTPGPLLIEPTTLIPQVDYQSGARVISGTSGTELVQLPAPYVTLAHGVDVVVLGDLDGDGVRELAVAMAGTGPSLAVASIYDGATLGGVSAILLPVPFGATPPLGPQSVSLELSELPDVSGDGVPDIAVGATYAFTGVSGRLGRIAVVSGADGSELHQLGSLDGASTDGTDFFGLGTSVASVGDVDGDGIADLAAGSPLDSGAGAVEFFGLGTPPLALDPVAGLVQGTIAGEVFPQPVVFRVRDASTGAPQPGRVVSFRALQGTVSPLTGTTNAAGEVGVTVTSPTTPNVGSVAQFIATVDGAPLEGTPVQLRARKLYVATTPFGLTVQYWHENFGVPLVIAVDAPLPSPGVIPTFFGDVYTSVASPGPSFGALDGIGVFGPADLTIAANPLFIRTFPLPPGTIPAGTTLVFQAYGIDLTYPFPANVFPSNPQILTF